MTDDEREASLERTRAAWATIEARHAASDKLGVPPLRKFARVWPPRLRRPGVLLRPDGTGSQEWWFGLRRDPSQGEERPR